MFNAQTSLVQEESYHVRRATVYKRPTKRRNDFWGRASDFFQGIVLSFCNFCLDDIIYEPVVSAEKLAENISVRPPALEKLVENTRFSAEWIKYMYQAFKQECPNGRMTKEDFSRIFRHYFPRACTDTYAERVFEAIDENSKGEILFQDLLQELSDLNLESDESKIYFVQKLLKVHRNDPIDLDRFIDYSKSIFELDGEPVVEGSRLVADFSCPFSPEVITFRATKAFMKLDRFDRGYVDCEDVEAFFNDKFEMEQIRGGPSPMVSIEIHSDRDPD